MSSGPSIRSTSWLVGLATGLSVAVAAVTSSCGVLAPWGEDDRSIGPMHVPPPHGYSTTQPVADPFTDGGQILRLKTDQEARIESIELVGAKDLEIVGTMLAPPPRKYRAEALMKRYPPRRPALFERSSLVQAEGAVIGGPGREARKLGWELVLGLQATEEGIASREAIRIVYTVEGRSFEALFPAELTVCTDKSFEVDKRCPFLVDL